MKTSASDIKSSSTDNEADFGRANAVNNALSGGWKGDFVSGAEQSTNKRRHWIEIQLVNEMMTVGVKVTAMKNNKGNEIFQKVSVRAGLTPTALSNGEDISGLQSHMDLTVYYDGPLAKEKSVHLLYDEPVNTKYIFLEGHLDSAFRWGFAEIYVMVEEEGIAYCQDGDPLNGINNNQKASVNLILILKNFYDRNKERTDGRVDRETFDLLMLELKREWDT